MAKRFSFSRQARVELTRDLPAGAITELERALSVTHRRVTDDQTSLRKLRSFQAIVRKLIRELERADSPARVSPQTLGELRRLLIPDAEKLLRRKDDAANDGGFRVLIESLALRVMKRHGLKTGGTRAAHVLALVHRERLGVRRTGDYTAELQALKRARANLRKDDPLRYPYPASDAEIGEWIGTNPL
jgi:hypothetical protein